MALDWYENNLHCVFFYCLFIMSKYDTLTFVHLYFMHFYQTIIELNSNYWYEMKFQEMNRILTEKSAIKHLVLTHQSATKHSMFLQSHTNGLCMMKMQLHSLNEMLVRRLPGQLVFLSPSTHVAHWACSYQPVKRI